MQVKQIAWRAILPKDTNVRWLLVITVLVFVSMSLLRPTMFFTLTTSARWPFNSRIWPLGHGDYADAALRGIDLSIVGVANLSGILAALVLTRLLPAEASALQVVLYSLLALATSLVTGLTCGLINGLLIAVVGITPILATLGTMELFTGIAIVITKGAAVFGFPELITFMGNGSLWIFPVPFLIFVVAAAVFAIIITKRHSVLSCSSSAPTPSPPDFPGSTIPNCCCKPTC